MDFVVALPGPAVLCLDDPGSAALVAAASEPVTYGTDPRSDYRIEACHRCGALTVDRQDLDDEITAMIPDFWFNVRRGTVDEVGLICDLCR